MIHIVNTFTPSMARGTHGYSKLSWKQINEKQAGLFVREVNPSERVSCVTDYMCAAYLSQSLGVEVKHDMSGFNHGKLEYEGLKCEDRILLVTSGVTGAYYWLITRID